MMTATKAAPTTDLERLEKKFSSLLADLLAAGHQSKWAVVSEDGVMAVFEDFGSAYSAARNKLDGAPFIVQQIQPRDHAEKITRLRWA